MNKEWTNAAVLFGARKFWAGRDEEQEEQGKEELH